MSLSCREMSSMPIQPIAPLMEMMQYDRKVELFPGLLAAHHYTIVEPSRDESKSEDDAFTVHRQVYSR